MRDLARIYGRTVQILVLFTFMAATSVAQVADGNIVGGIFDQTGAAVAGAQVEVEHDTTGVVETVSSDASGFYRVDNLLVGEYTIRVEANGFATARLQNVEVRLSKTTTANITMLPGQTTFSVDVTAPALLVDAATYEIANTYGTRLAADLPSAANTDGGYLNLSLLSAGVASSGGTGDGTGPSVGGQRPRNNNYTIEGTDNNRKDVTGPVVNLPNDAVAEFTVLQNQFSAEFGHSSGGQFNTVIRSGTNNFHGRLYEYFQNRYLNAMDEIFKRQGLSQRPRYDSNLMGVSLGGPVIHNKLFFFGNMDYNPVGYATSSVSRITAPTAAGYQTLAGMSGISQNNLSALQQYLGPAPAQTGNETATVNGVAIPLGIVPAVAPAYVNNHRGMASVDYSISDTDQLRGRYIINQMRGIDTRAQLPSFYTQRPINGYVASVSEFHTFSPSVVNEVRMAYNRYNDSQMVPNVSFPGLSAFPNIVLNDVGLQFGPNPNTPQAVTQNVYQLVDNLTWNVGNHDFKFGFDGRNIISSIDSISAVRGDYQYSTLQRYLNDLTPDVMAARGVGSLPYRGNTNAFYLYANDNWKATRSLTINLGVRWEYNGVSKSMKEFALNSIANVPGVLTFSAPKPQMKNFAPRVGFAWAPGNGRTTIRGGFGMAYDQIFDNIGRNVRPPQSNSTIIGTRNDQGNYLANGGIPGNSIPATMDAATARANTTGWLPNQKLAYAMNWNFGIQHQFGNDYVLDVRYLATRGVHLLSQTRLNTQSIVTPTNSLPTYFTAPSQAQLNSLSLTNYDLFGQAFSQINPLAQYGFSNIITSYVPRGSSFYNGLAVDLRKRFSSNLMMQVSYTWSHLLDNSTAEVNTTALSPRRPQNFSDMRSEWGTSALDRRHRLTVTTMYDTPWFRSNGNWFLRNIVGNYSLSGTYTFESPQYVTPQSPLDANLNFDDQTDRTIVNPNGVPGTATGVTPLTNSDGDVVAYLANNPNAQYVAAGYGAYATGGRNTLRTNPINNFDLSAMKTLPVGESKRVQIRADFFNALNHAQFVPGRVNSVNSTQNFNRSALLAGNALFGQWNQVYPSNARIIQLVAKFIF